MSAAAAPSPPTGLMPRFYLFIEAMKRGLVDGARYRQAVVPLGPLGPLIGVLLNYLVHTRRRLDALHARFAAGKLPAPRRGAAPRPAAERARAERRPPAIPPGPVFVEYGIGFFADHLRALLDDPEMRALLAASPQAGRLLRPLWRKLTPDPLPEALREPPRPRRPKPLRVARQESPGGNPSPQPLVCSSQPEPLTRGEGEAGRSAWYPVSLWSDPALTAEPSPPLPAWPKPPWPD